MNTLYEEMLVRLSNYRESRNLSQKEMGHLIGLTQSHYSKVERGIKVLSGMALISLSNFQVDVDFVLTGQRAKYTELNERMERCREQDREELARLIVWFVRQGAHLMEVRDGTDDMNYVKAAELFHMKEWNTKVSESIWYGIRRNNGYTQQQMADVLDINIKKYREIEKENRIPDAEVLVNLYETTGIVPSALLEGELHNLNALNQIWERFPESIKTKLLEILDRAIALFQE